MKTLISLALFTLLSSAATAAVVVKPAPPPVTLLTPEQAAARFASLFPSRGDSNDTGGVNCPAVVIGACHSHPNK